MIHRPLFSLDSRLQLCASMVRENTKLADIGTDHAYLPIWLVKKSIITKAIAADINIGPLQKAASNIRRYHVEDMVDARLSDGLDEIFPHEADDIVIAGMGGELISQLIAKAAWLKDETKHLILQPMTSAEELRRYLLSEGFMVEQEQAVEDEKHVYSVMLAVYTPSSVPQDELFPYIGLIKADTQANKNYLQRQINSLEKKANGLQVSGKTEESNKLFDIIEKIKNRMN